LKADVVRKLENINSPDDPELAQACIAGIKALRDSLELLTDDKSVVLLSIG